MSPFAGPSFSIAIQSDASTVYPWETAKLECSLGVSGSSPKTGTTAEPTLAHLYLLSVCVKSELVHVKLQCNDTTTFRNLYLVELLDHCIETYSLLAKLLFRQ